MKSESSESSPASRPSTEPSTPDTASVTESATTNHSVQETNETTTSTLTVQSSPSSGDGGSVKKGKKGKDENKGEEKKGGKDSNLVGKITNLVSTDLGNIVDGRDFPILFISLPLQIILCVVFLYKVLGWSAIVGMGAMLVLYPLPGWVASKMQGVQREKMKIVSQVTPSALRNSFSSRPFSTDGRTRSGCDRSYECHPHDQSLRLGETYRREDCGQT